MDSQPEPGWNHFDGMRAEYLAAVAVFPLPLPPSFTFPVEPEARHDETLYADGYGEVAALFTWLLAVEKAALDAHESGNTADAQHWVEVAAMFSGTDTFAMYNDPNVPISWHDAVIVPARRGDFASMAEEYEAATR